MREVKYLKSQAKYLGPGKALEVPRKVGGKKNIPVEASMLEREMVSRHPDRTVFLETGNGTSQPPNRDVPSRAPNCTLQGCICQTSLSRPNLPVTMEATDMSGCL